MKKIIKISGILFILSIIGVICVNKTIKRNGKKIMSYKPYTIQEQLKPAGLQGISDKQINDHWNLYKGYVNNVNTLNEDLIRMTKEGKAGSLLYADRKRRAGFEYNGMVLHELYFGNLTAKKTSPEGKKVKQAIEKIWGSFDTWLNDFIQTGKSRSIGWAILFKDNNTGNLSNHFIMEHGNGIVAGFSPLLVMDVWEHAYMVDHTAGGRGDYIDNFIKNINWDVVETRYNL
jgi:Fe-Mn family superoxide dismutase